MKFKVQTVACFYDEEDKKKLEALGFKFKPYSIQEHKRVGGKYFPYYKIDSSVNIEINTLEELMKFQDEWGQLIINQDCITIFDGYL